MSCLPTLSSVSPGQTPWHTIPLHLPCIYCNKASAEAVHQKWPQANSTVALGIRSVIPIFHLNNVAPTSKWMVTAIKDNDHQLSLPFYMAVLASHETSGLSFELRSWKQSQDRETGLEPNLKTTFWQSFAKHRGLRKDVTQEQGWVIAFKVGSGSFLTHTPPPPPTHTRKLWRTYIWGRGTF